MKDLAYAAAVAPDPVHPKPLLGRIAVVTGGSRGIGASIARELGAAGAHVVVNYLNGAEAAAGVVAQIEAAGGAGDAQAADVSKAKEVHGLFERIKSKYGRVDVLVNNAGILRDRTFKKMALEDWHAVIDVNLSSVMNACHYAVPMLLENGWGRIINISSFVGQMGNFGQANYSAAKAGILGFTKSLAIELARYNVTVNAVCPGFVDTEMWRSVPANIQEKILERIPMHRVARPEEIARGVRFLAVEGDYLTGQSLNINGGIYMGWREGASEVLRTASVAFRPSLGYGDTRASCASPRSSCAKAHFVAELLAGELQRHLLILVDVISVRFLGTGGARFVVARQIRASGGMWMRFGATQIHVDPGPGALVRALGSVPPCVPAELDAIVLSHKHLDHSNDVNVMVEAMTQGGWKPRGALLAPRDAFEGEPVILPYVRAFVSREVVLEASGGPHIVNDVEIRTSLPHVHGVQTYGLHFRRAGMTVSYLPCGRFFEGLIEDYRAHAPDVLILNVLRYRDAMEADHLTFDEARRLIAGIRPRIAVMTHFGTKMLEQQPALLARALEEDLGLRVYAAYDGWVLEA